MPVCKNFLGNRKVQGLLRTTSFKSWFYLFMVVLLVTSLAGCGKAPQADIEATIDARVALEFIDRGDLDCFTPVDVEPAAVDSSKQGHLVLEAESPANQRNLYLLDVETGEVTGVAQNIYGPGINPSPDKMKVLFERIDHKWSIYSIRERTTTPFDLDVNPVWTPNSSCLIFPEIKGYLGLYRLSDGARSDFAPGWLQNYVKSQDHSIDQMTLSPDGTKLAFACRQFDICLAEIRGNSFIIIPRPQEKRLRFPVWLNNTELGYTLNRIGHYFPDAASDVGLYQVKTAERRIWEMPGMMFRIVPGPERHSISAAILSNNRNILQEDGKDFGVVNINLLDGEVQKVFAFSEDIGVLSWSPSGQQLAMIIFSYDTTPIAHPIYVYDGFSVRSLPIHGVEEKDQDYIDIYWVN